MDRIEEKRLKEKMIVSDMIQLYCKKKHKMKDGLCEECARLDAYAKLRSDHCPFMATKTFCSNCQVHCYKSDMRQQIKKVMRYSGPRMIFYHPCAALSHVIESKKEKRRLEKKHED